MSKTGDENAREEIYILRGPYGTVEEANSARAVMASERRFPSMQVVFLPPAWFPGAERDIERVLTAAGEPMPPIAKGPLAERVKAALEKRLTHAESTELGLLVIDHKQVRELLDEAGWLPGEPCARRVKRLLEVKEQESQKATWEQTRRIQAEVEVGRLKAQLAHADGLLASRIGSQSAGPVGVRLAPHPAELLGEAVTGYAKMIEHAVRDLLNLRKWKPQ